MERLKTKTEEEYLGLADRLDELQATKNDGRGIGCVRDIIMFLRKDHVDDARSTAAHDGDKIRNYPDVEKIISEELFNGESYPYSRWYRERLNEIKGP